MKNDAGLCPMKRAFGTCGRGGALRFMFAKQTHHASVARASYRRKPMLHIDEVDVSLKNIRVVILTPKLKPCLVTRLFSFVKAY